MQGIDTACVACSVCACGGSGSILPQENVEMYTTSETVGDHHKHIKCMATGV